MRMIPMLDELLEEAARLVVRHQQGSVSFLQRWLKIGYSRAARIVDQLEVGGIVGPYDGSKAREVIIKDEAQLPDLILKLTHISNDHKNLLLENMTKMKELLEHWNPLGGRCNVMEDK
jgi:hypothetical protein